MKSTELQDYQFNPSTGLYTHIDDLELVNQISQVRDQLYELTREVKHSPEAERSKGRRQIRKLQAHLDELSHNLAESTHTRYNSASWLKNAICQEFKGLTAEATETLSEIKTTLLSAKSISYELSWHLDRLVSAERRMERYAQLSLRLSTTSDLHQVLKAITSWKADLTYEILRHASRTSASTSLSSNLIETLEIAADTELLQHTGWALSTANFAIANDLLIED